MFDCKSLLKKYLTRQMFEKLKDFKTKQGCDLKSCIKSGIDNLDSGNGVYASDAEAYVVFADIFNSIIIGYHKLDSLDGFKYSFPADLDPDGNVTGYPLRGGMNEQQTMELETKIKDILEGYRDKDLKGMK